MQRTAIIPLLAAGILTSSAVFAQTKKHPDAAHYNKQETVIISDDKPETVIEIKNGSVYLNGSVLARVSEEDADIYKKIIIRKDGGGGARLEQDDFIPFHNEEMAEERGPAGKRAMLGVLTDSRDGTRGALVKEVTPNSPAEKAGIQSGDRILKIDSRSIADAADLSEEIGSGHRAGDEVTISYERNGKNRTTSAVLTAAPASRNNMRRYQFDQRDMGNNMPRAFFHAFPDMNDDRMETRPRIGVSVEDRIEGTGVTVVEVAPSSVAAIAGLKKGDVINRLDNEQINTVTELQDMVSHSKPGQHFNLKYTRNGKEMTAELVMPRTMNRKDL